MVEFIQGGLVQSSIKQRQQQLKDIALFGEVLADNFPDRQIIGGAPYNVTRHLHGFGYNAVLITRTGNDDLKTQVLAEMEAHDLNTIGVQHDLLHPTGQVDVSLNNGEPSYDILNNQAYDYIHAGIAHMVTVSLKPKVAYFGTLAQRNLTSRLALDKFLNDAHCLRFLDMNLREPWYDHHTIRRSLLRADVLKLNQTELKTVADECRLKFTDVQDQAKELLTKYDINEMVVTNGEEGAWHINKALQVTHVKQAETVDVVDTVGAGDGFAAVYILGLIKAWETEEILQRANAFAANICQINGAVPDNLDFYQPYTDAWHV